MPFVNYFKFLSSLYKTDVFKKMNNCCFEIKTSIYVVIILAAIIDGSYSVNVFNEDDTFLVNVTMKDFQTTQVDIYWKSCFVFSDKT